ncbi:hypothetical protein QBA54_31935 [Streptomyces sp. B21-108]|uniref:hypothetical protein n=1 Tax=Streptomyces sp. B21-108 TaxID=3039419 RepID=UPI002FEF8D00
MRSTDCDDQADELKGQAAPTVLPRAWLHHCGRLVAGTDTTWCPGCRCDLKRPSEVEARYVLVPMQGPQMDA